MKLKNLPKEALIDLDSAFKSSKNAKEKTRIQAVMLRYNGFSHNDISTITKLSVSSIEALITIYNKLGLPGLMLKPMPKNHHKLTDSQKLEIKNIIIDENNTPEKMGLGSDLRFWSTPLLKLLVKNKFGVTYNSDRSYHKLFDFCGLSFHKPQKVNKKQDPKKANEFVISAKKRLDGTYRTITVSW